MSGPANPIPWYLADQDDKDVASLLAIGTTRRRAIESVARRMDQHAAACADSEIRACFVARAARVRCLTPL